MRYQYLSNNNTNNHSSFKLKYLRRVFSIFVLLTDSRNPSTVVPELILSLVKWLRNLVQLLLRLRSFVLLRYSLLWSQTKCGSSTKTWNFNAFVLRALESRSARMKISTVEKYRRVKEGGRKKGNESRYCKIVARLPSEFYLDRKWSVCATV